MARPIGDYSQEPSNVKSVGIGFGVWQCVYDMPPTNGRGFDFLGARTFSSERSTLLLRRVAIRATRVCELSWDRDDAS